MSGATPPGGPAASLGYRPLYRQVKDILLTRLSDGTWAPGALLPSEPEIAAGLGVSPGTVRKALDEMTAENLLVRRQGRGTFVAVHDEERILFRYFRMVSDTGERRFPESRILSIDTGEATAEIAERLRIPQRRSVVIVERVRLLDGHPCIHEWITLPSARFPGLRARKDLPNNLYALYARDYGVTIARATERLKAVAAKAEQASVLAIPEGEPLLLIDRTALALDGSTVEWRRSLCRTDEWHYHSDLR